jgi:cell division septation protein DedD
MVGLSNVEADVKKNLDLLKTRAWLDVPLVYTNQHRAILAIESGARGERAFAAALAAWEQPQAVAAPAPATSRDPLSWLGGSYVVQVSSQRNEADAQASYKALQGKFPAVLGPRAPLIRRVDLGDKGVYYRVVIGPFDTSDAAAQVCGDLKTAGGQCVVQRN